MSFVHSPTMAAVQYTQQYTPIMSLKRKRSESAVSPSPASPEDYSNPSQTVPILTPPLYRNSSQSNFSEASHLHSRTRKRYRDNRPDEDTVHSALLIRSSSIVIVLTNPRNNIRKTLLCLSLTFVRPRHAEGRSFFYWQYNCRARSTPEKLGPIFASQFLDTAVDCTPNYRRCRPHQTRTESHLQGLRCTFRSIKCLRRRLYGWHG